MHLRDVAINIYCKNPQLFVRILFIQKVGECLRPKNTFQWNIIFDRNTVNAIASLTLFY